MLCMVFENCIFCYYKLGKIAETNKGFISQFLVNIILLFESQCHFRKDKQANNYDLSTCERSQFLRKIRIIFTN